ncbi:hypothetical protein GGX14DRAFT_662106 [Mycena pura]|uniref:Uncharacterized protein n=1 Tax=Mycena pura TaxID=153505 RepID=A0AAD6V0I7_9AGAR|nr:hypothetical protein GGX14DRAFT_662106 [Mycena pura]
MSFFASFSFQGDYFPNYTGGDRFDAAKLPLDQGMRFYARCTCLTDQASAAARLAFLVALVLGAMQDTLLQTAQMYPRGRPAGENGGLSADRPRPLGILVIFVCHAPRATADVLLPYTDAPSAPSGRDVRDGLLAHPASRRVEPIPSVIDLPAPAGGEPRERERTQRAREMDLDAVAACSGGAQVRDNEGKAVDDADPVKHDADVLTVYAGMVVIACEGTPVLFEKVGWMWP